LEIPIKSFLSLLKSIFFTRYKSTTKELFTHLYSEWQLRESFVFWRITESIIDQCSHCFFIELLYYYRSICLFYLIIWIRKNLIFSFLLLLFFLALFLSLFVSFLCEPFCIWMHSVTIIAPSFLLHYLSKSFLTGHREAMRKYRIT